MISVDASICSKILQEALGASIRTRPLIANPAVGICALAGAKVELEPELLLLDQPFWYL
jgi:hypothetical protein